MESKNSVLLIVPTRGRPQKSLEFYEAFKDNSHITNLVFGLDDDDVEYPRIPGVMYETNPRIMMNGTLNLIANKYANQYDYIAFMGDDHRIRTDGWDVKLVDSIKNLKNGIAYGNDLFQGQTLPTAVLMDSNIIKTLGFMAPPKQKHLYLDNFWLDLGTSLQTIRYHDDVIIEHVHFANNKAEKDSGYEEVNSSEINNHDKAEYTKYVESQMQSDLDKLRTSISAVVKRLKPKWSDEELQRIYSRPYDHTRWSDHIIRIKNTIDFAVKHLSDKDILSVGDLSAGDGAIANALPFDKKILGDFCPGFEYCGKIEETIKQIEPVDVFILSETLEHLDNPLEVLKQIREKTKYLLLSTPEDNWDDNNEEHYWAWNRDGVKNLLEDAGFEPIKYMSDKLYYTHQYWICKRAEAGFAKTCNSTEWKLFDGETCEYAKAEWYLNRNTVHHLEEPGHAERIFKAVDLIKHAINLGAKTLVDFGCGDGGLLQLLKDENINAWGYDLCPSNIKYATDVRNVDARYVDFVNSPVEYGDISVFTEVLEHMENPHQFIKNLNSKFIVVSSPYHETNLNHYEFHLWAWNMDGYRALLENNGYKVLVSTTALGWCQVLLGVKENELSWWMIK